MDMRLTLLGTGNAAGVPLYGCECSYCRAARNNRALRRTPCSALLEVGDRQYLLDAGQINFCERFPSGAIDEKVCPKQTILTYIGHDLDIWLLNNQTRLPPHISVGKDGVTVFPMTS